MHLLKRKTNNRTLQILQNKLQLSVDNIDLPNWFEKLWIAFINFFFLRNYYTKIKYTSFSTE